MLCKSAYSKRYLNTHRGIVHIRWITGRHFTCKRAAGLLAQ